MMTRELKRIAVFCGSSLGNHTDYAEITKKLSIALVNENIQLVYGGANVGLMGILANQVLQSGGEVVGVIPRTLVEKEIAHPQLTKLHIVETMHERKQLIAELSDGFITLPGGSGSLEEFFEIFTWSQLGYHTKPFGILNIRNYYDPLLYFLKHTVTEGFMKSEFLQNMIIETEPTLLIEKLYHYKASNIIKWLPQSAASSP